MAQRSLALSRQEARPPPRNHTLGGSNLGGGRGIMAGRGWPRARGRRRRPPRARRAVAALIHPVVGKQPCAKFPTTPAWQQPW
jgi:hypothetical protein